MLLTTKGQILFSPLEHLTPASWACVQEFVLLKFAVHSVSSLSLPVHCTLFNHIIPVPSPKLDPVSEPDE